MSGSCPTGALLFCKVFSGPRQRTSSHLFSLAIWPTHILAPHPLSRAWPIVLHAQTGGGNWWMGLLPVNRANDLIKVNEWATRNECEVTSRSWYIYLAFLTCNHSSSSLATEHIYFHRSTFYSSSQRQEGYQRLLDTLSSGISTKMDTFSASLSESLCSDTHLAETPRVPPASQRFIDSCVVNTIATVCFGDLELDDFLLDSRADTDGDGVNGVLGMSFISGEEEGRVSAGNLHSSLRYPLSSTRVPRSRVNLDQALDSIEEVSTYSSRRDSGFASMDQEVPDYRFIPRPECYGEEEPATENLEATTFSICSDSTEFYQQPLNKLPVTQSKTTKEGSRRRSIAKSLKKVGRLLKSKGSSPKLELLAVLWIILGCGWMKRYRPLRRWDLN